MQYIFMALAVLGIVGVDQWVKFLVLENIPLHSVTAAIPGLFSLTYVQNTGAAWSSFQGMIWLFVLIFVIFTAFLVFEFVTGKVGFDTFEKWCMIVIYGGAVGNIIDRLRLGFVVDMIQLDFMQFPIFNVADCFICVGAFTLIVYMLFFSKTWKEKT